MPVSLATLTDSFLAHLGPNPKQNIDTIVCKTCELLKCDSAVYACSDTETGAVRMRSAYNLPLRPATERELARRVCAEIISAGVAAPASAIEDAGRNNSLAARTLAQSNFKAFLGCPVNVNGKSGGALAVLYTRWRRFSGEDRRLIAFLARILSIEDSRYQREKDWTKPFAEELVGSRRSVAKTVAEKTIALRKANDRLAAEVAAHKKTISALKNREAEIQRRNEALLELNNALTATLKNRTCDIGEAEEKIFRNMNTLMDPALQGLRLNDSGMPKEEWVETLKGGLKKLIVLLRNRSSYIYQCLTPAEIAVAKLIAQDKATKEIAKSLKLSRRTVEGHRYNIRKKLGIGKSNMNLKSYFLTME